MQTPQSIIDMPKYNAGVHLARRVQEGAGPHLLHVNGDANENEVTAIIVVEGLVVLVVLQSAKIIVCKRLAISSDNSGPTLSVEKT